jgi:glycosyltransferase involved in cell wall biosynthesis
MKVAVIAVGSKTGEQGGAERFYQGLTNALNAAGVEADQIKVVSDESCFEAIEETLLRFYDLDLAQYDGVISTKNPSYLVRHPNHICYLVHTMRVFYDMFDTEYPLVMEPIQKQRELIQAIDKLALSFPRTRKLFAIGNEVRNRLLEFIGVDCEVMYPGISGDLFYCRSYEYIFIPGRLHRWKRVNLIIEAMRYVKAPVKLIISGTGEDEKHLKAVAVGDARIVFVGRVSDAELLSLYADALCVPFVPVREDLGLVTIEAFRSSKPVITCVDSGEPAYIVKHKESGFICQPIPSEIANCIDFLYNHRDVAKSMGERGRQSVGHICWEDVATRLISTLNTG